ncbi:MAG: DUF1326 domain-containing protein [Candidatus Omnitrophica bacterium]|nr:DUF1326 domain-containing protein [Candidatus Omnitrophota bacterium]
MKKKAVILLGLGWLAVNNVAAGDMPSGRLIELHSCEVYAGGCIVSSQATLEGRYMLRIWDISQGVYAGVDLGGLQAIALQVSQANLAQPRAGSAKAVVYLPAAATDAQRKALLEWLKSIDPEFEQIRLHTRVVPIHLERSSSGDAVSAGKYVHLEVRPLERCDTGSCGEQLWYQPRTPTLAFTVGLNQRSEVREPWLELKWDDRGQRSVFVARFGQDAPSNNVYLSATDCDGPALSLY